LEYRGLAGSIPGGDFARFLVDIVRLKLAQDEAVVLADCRMAAKENRLTGVAFVGEHTDRPFSGRAMAESGLDGVLYQEIVTVSPDSPFESIVADRRQRISEQKGWFAGRTGWALHAPYTVDEDTFREFAQGEDDLSVHLAESHSERELFENGSGPLADFLVSLRAPLPRCAGGPVAWLSQLGVLRPGVQCVHLCASGPSDVDILAESGVSAAHCPSSNEYLGCPVAPVRRLLDSGVKTGLGLDSAASGGEVDMFKEMRHALIQSVRRGEPLTAGQVWDMATTGGAASLGVTDWRIEPGSRVPLIVVDVPGALDLSDLIERGDPGAVRWI
jgi:5-methylthioadenosine/S-adenosylhomocysteine deaminase